MIRVAAAAVLLLLLLACGRDELASVEAAPDQHQPSSLAQTELVRVDRDSLRATIAATGSIEARRVSELGAEVGGRLIEIHVDVGDVVAAGDPLFRIDPVPYENALAEARAGLALARAERQNAQEEASRMQKLAERKAVSEQRRDQILTQAKVTRARVEQMEARLARAERELELTQVRAPYAGSIVERRVDEGAIAGTGPIVVLQETGALEAILNVPESSPVGVRVGHPVRLFVQGRPDPFTSVVSAVSDRVDEMTRTYEVRARIDDPERSTKAGSYVRAEIEAVRSRALPVVDRAALLLRDGRTYVFRVEGDVVAQVPVRVGVQEGERAEILSGIAPGDVVVRGDAVQRLQDGDHIGRSQEHEVATREEAGS